MRLWGVLCVGFGLVLLTAVGAAAGGPSHRRAQTQHVRRVTHHVIAKKKKVVVPKATPKPSTSPSPVAAATPPLLPAPPSDQPSAPAPSIAAPDPAGGVSVAIATDPKIAPDLSGSAVAAVSQDAVAQIHVIVYGTDAADALTGVDATGVQSLDLIGAASGTMAAADLPTLTDDDGVDLVVVDSPVVSTDDGAATTTTSTTTTATPPPATAQSTLATLFPLVDDVTPAWSAGDDGSGIGIAVIDSGTTAVPDLAGRVTQVALPGQTGSLDDAYGHGTFVATVAAGKSASGAYMGIAPGASIYALNVNDNGAVYTSDVLNALAWVATHAQADNIRVVNLSVAETTPSSYTTSALDQAVEAVWKLGITVVASSGNGGPNSEYYAPANDPFAITVGASDPNDTLSTDDDLLASFSSYGTTPDGFTKPEIVAPGRHIVADEPSGTTLDLMAPDANHVAPGYLMMNGTSFSAPQVSGAVALLLQAHPSWSPDEVKGALVSTERPLAGSNAGALDIGAAIALTQRPQKANQGIAYSVGPVKQLLNQVAQLNSAANDAVSFQRAAVGYDASQNYLLSGQLWAQAGNRWERLNQLVNAAAAFDRSAADDAQLADWTDAAQAWEEAGSDLSNNVW
jgi:subtilisin family serine protease